MALFLIRHTPVDAAPGAIYGQREVALAADWPDRFRALAEALPDGVGRICTSPLSRCRKLAYWLQAARWPQATLQVISDLVEMSFGRWEGQSWSTIPRAELDVWASDWVNHPPPGGESFLQVRERWRRVLAGLDDAAGHVLLVTHAGMIRVALTDYLGLPPGAAFALKVGFGEVYRLRYPANF
ncbi:histidine phosphatase family protein [Hahella sp. SMD15-11]|uniref:Histidine phosphatase family protein n=1 Tax=Thermohahella caldifontis TaxID=3142973 RepID=A0AB39UWY9_9GAMM